MKRTLALLTLVFTAARLFGVDTIHFTQISMDRLVNDPDFGYEVRTTESGTIAATITVPGLNINDVTDDTPLEISIGNFQWYRVVGEGDNVSSGCVRFSDETGFNLYIDASSSKPNNSTIQFIQR